MRPWPTGSRPTPGTCRGGLRNARRGACWSARSCCSRRRWCGCCRSGRSGCGAGRSLPIWPASLPGKPSGPGAGWDIRGAPCACTRPPSPSATATAASRPRHVPGTPGAARRGQLHRGGRRRLRLRAPRNRGGHQHPPGPRAPVLRLGPAVAGPDRRRNAAGRASLLPDDAGASVRWNASVMELGALVCTARSPKCGECPVRGLLRLAGGRRAAADVHAQGAVVARHGPPGARRRDGRPPRGRVAGGAGAVPPGPRGPWLRTAGDRNPARRPAPAQRGPRAAGTRAGRAAGRRPGRTAPGRLPASRPEDLRWSMRKLAAAAALVLTAVLAVSCRPEAACPAIAQAPVVSLTVDREYAPSVKTIHLRACQDGRCKEADLELVPGSTAVDQGCEPGPYGGDGVCSATSSPDGTLTGMLMMETLTRQPHRGDGHGHGHRREPAAGPDRGVHAPRGAPVWRAVRNLHHGQRGARRGRPPAGTLAPTVLRTPS